MRSSPEARLSLGLLLISLGAIAAFLRLGFGPVSSRPVVRGPSRLPTGQAHAGTTFADRTVECGLQNFVHTDAMNPRLPALLAPGVGVLDLDLDGDLDLVALAGSEADVGLRIFRNLLVEQGSLSFQDVTDLCGITWSGAAQGLCAGDYDNDGDVDLFVTALGPNLLLRNLLDGRESGLRFEDVTQSAGVAGRLYRLATSSAGEPRVERGEPQDPAGAILEFSTGATFADFDADGDLDLYVANSMALHEAFCPPSTDASAPDASWFPPLPDALYVNDGAGRFQESRAIPSDSSPRRSIGAVATQLDDHLPDLCITHDDGLNSVLRNQRPTMTDVAPNLGLDRSSGSGIAVGDPDNDGDLDFLFPNWPARRLGLLLRGEHLDQQSRRQPLFEEPENLGGLRDPMKDELIGRGVVFFDYNNDGLLDIALANGSSMFTTPDGAAGAQPLQLFRNLGSGRMFQEVSQDAGEPFRRLYRGRGLVAGDLDRDGDLDLVLAQNQGPLSVLINELPERERLCSAKLALNLPKHGAVPGRADAINARILIETGAMTQMQEMLSGGSFLSQSPLEFHFGLGDNPRIDRLTLILPWGLTVLGPLTRAEISQVRVQ